jgi:hypothetical protein
MQKCVQHTSSAGAAPRRALLSQTLTQSSSLHDRVTLTDRQARHIREHPSSLDGKLRVVVSKLTCQHGGQRLHLVFDLGQTNKFVVVELVVHSVVVATLVLLGVHLARLVALLVALQLSGVTGVVLHRDHTLAVLVVDVVSDLETVDDSEHETVFREDSQDTLDVEGHGFLS